MIHLPFLATQLTNLFPLFLSGSQQFHPLHSIHTLDFCVLRATCVSLLSPRVTLTSWPVTSVTPDRVFHRLILTEWSRPLLSLSSFLSRDPVTESHRSSHLSTCSRATTLNQSFLVFFCHSFHSFTYFTFNGLVYRWRCECECVIPLTASPVQMYHWKQQLSSYF